MILPIGCRTRSDAFVIALGDNIRTIDPIGSPSVDAASERVRTLIFNSLVKKDERFDYTGELASNILRSDDGLTFTFTLHDGVKFHDGQVLSSADVKYTENNQVVPVGDGFWKTAQGIGNYKHYFADPEAGQVAFMGTLREANAPFVTVMLEGVYTDAYLETTGADAPRFTDEELRTIAAPLDFVGINVYRPMEYVEPSDDVPGHAPVAMISVSVEIVPSSV